MVKFICMYLHVAISIQHSMCPPRHIKANTYCVHVIFFFDYLPEHAAAIPIFMVFVMRVKTECAQANLEPPVV